MAFTNRTKLAAAALAAVLLGVTTWLYRDARREPPLTIGGYVLVEPRALPAVELFDENDARFRPADFAGRWSFLYFGYTHCPDVCPLALLEFATLKKQLETQLPAERTAYYLVTVDPARDTPARLRDYVTYFDSTFHGLTGPADSLAELAKTTETLYFVPAGQDPDHYLVSHSSNVVLLNPDGALHAVFTPPHDPTQLAADFSRVVAHYAARH